MILTLEEAICEVLLAHREHQTMLMFGGHSGKKVDDAIDQLEEAFRETRKPQGLKAVS